MGSVMLPWGGGGTAPVATGVGGALVPGALPGVGRAPGPAAETVWLRVPPGPTVVPGAGPTGTMRTGFEPPDGIIPPRFPTRRGWPAIMALALTACALPAPVVVVSVRAGSEVPAV